MKNTPSETIGQPWPASSAGVKVTVPHDSQLGLARRGPLQASLLAPSFARTQDRPSLIGFVLTVFIPLTF
jgi:hypothetical protein